MHNMYCLVTFFKDILLWAQQKDKILPSISPNKCFVKNLYINLYACHENGLIIISDGQSTLLFTFKSGKFQLLKQPTPNNVPGNVKALEFVDGCYLQYLSHNRIKEDKDCIHALVLYSEGLIAIYNTNYNCELFLTHKFSHKLTHIRASHSNYGSFVVASETGCLCVWNIQTNNLSEPFQLPSPYQEITDIQFSFECPDLFAVTCLDNTVFLFTLNSSASNIQHLYTYPSPFFNKVPNHLNECKSISFSPSNEFLFLSSNTNGFFTCYDSISHKVILKHNTERRLENVTVSKDAYTIVFGTRKDLDEAQKSPLLLIYDLRSHKKPRDIVDVASHHNMPAADDDKSMTPHLGGVKACFTDFNVDLRKVFVSSLYDKSRNHSLPEEQSNGIVESQALIEERLSYGSRELDSKDSLNKSIGFLSPIKHIPPSFNSLESTRSGRQQNGDDAHLFTDTNISDETVDSSRNKIKGNSTNHVNGKLSPSLPSSNNVPAISRSQLEIAESPASISMKDASILPDKYSTKHKGCGGDIGTSAVEGSTSPLSIPSSSCTCEQLKDSLSDLTHSLHMDIVNMHMDTIKGFHENQVVMRNYLREIWAQQKDCLEEMQVIKTRIQDLDDQIYGIANK